ncbi:MAG TPA: PilZ domain-containing protein [Devosia sp.]|nr:PilZ domain-containing protein [Devosia sp.]
MSSAAKTAAVRFIGPVMGRYALESRMRTGGVQIFACRLQSISTTQIVASAPVLGCLAEGITVNFEPFGTLRGQVVRHVDGGFGMEIDADPEDRDKLASKIDWYKKRTFAGLTDKRKHRRFMPREPRSALILANGHVLPCLIIDMSASGAAVSADVDPPIGEPLAIGRVVARVVRRLEVGFAVRFLSELELETMEEMLRAPDEWEHAIAVQREAEAGQRRALFAELVASADGERPGAVDDYTI